MKEICKRLNIDTKIYKERSLLAAISSAKDELVSPTQFALQAAASSDFAKKKQAQVYQEYQAALQKNNALDFDDLIVKTVELLQTDPEVLAYYQERFRYIMVDEYQDTNTAQFELIRLLAGKYKTCAWSVMTISRSTSSGVPTSTIFWTMKNIFRKLRSSSWSKTTVRPRRFWMLPTR